MTTNNAINVGTGTTGQILQANTGAASTFTTATYPGTTTANQILYSSATNVVGQITAANSATMVTSGAGVPSLQTLTAGQILIGTTASAPAAATITGSVGVTVSATSGAIAISGNGAKPWVDQTGASVTMAVNTNYVADRATAITFTVPATAAVGDSFSIVGLLAGLSVVQMNAGQTCHFGSSATSVAGTMTATNQYDAIEFVCLTANTVFGVKSSIGNWTVA